jgi:hypothetical protein
VQVFAGRNPHQNEEKWHLGATFQPYKVSLSKRMIKMSLFLLLKITFADFGHARYIPVTHTTKAKLER